MSANLLGQRFYHNRETPAWHGLGINSAVARTASEALEETGGSYTVEKRPLKVFLDGDEQPSGFYSLVRSPIQEDPVERIFGTPVSEEFYPITPAEAAGIYDSYVRNPDSGEISPVETFGILGQGERMFISTQLPSIDVKGDEIAVYMLFDNPLVNGSAMGVYTTGQRVVCQNTLMIALGNTIQRKTIQHLQGAADQIGEWLREVYHNAVITRQLMEEAYQTLANRPISGVQIEWVVNNTYKMPVMPTEEDTSYLPLPQRLERWDREVALTRRLRTLATSLIEDGTGMDSPAVRGTAFGAFNGVAELETYRRGKTAKVVSGLLNGPRAKRIQNAFTLAMHASEVSEYTDATADALGLVLVKAS